MNTPIIPLPSRERILLFLEVDVVKWMEGLLLALVAGLLTLVVAAALL